MKTLRNEERFDFQKERKKERKIFESEAGREAKIEEYIKKQG